MTKFKKCAMRECRKILPRGAQFQIEFKNRKVLVCQVCFENEMKDPRIEVSLSVQALYDPEVIARQKRYAIEGKALPKEEKRHYVGHTVK